MSSSHSNEEVKLPLHENLRKLDIPFDFAINVEGESSPVHQITLTTHSEYFRAMLAHDTKEKQQGFVDMKEVSLEGVRECVEFMYSGKVNVEAETVEDILQAADMIQLSKVIEICAEVLNQILESGNCFSVYNLATKYSFSELQEKTLKIFKGECVIKITELLQISKDGFTEFLETHTLGNEFAWDCIINWIKYDLEKRSEFIYNFVKLLDWDKFPSAKLLKRTWGESVYRKSQKCRNFIFENLFLDLGKLDLNLCLENYFILKTLSDEFKYVIKEIKDLFHNFLKFNFLVLSRQSSFKLLNEDEFVSLFTDEASRGIVAEKWKWNAMITWIKQDHNRKKYLLKLMKTIRFNHLSRSFLEINVRNEPLIKESKECSLFFFVDVILGQMAPKQTPASVAVLYSDGRVRFLNVSSKSWTELLKCPKPVQNAVIFNFNGKLCLINGAKLLYLHGRQWIERQSMTSDITGLKKITTLGDCIYVVSENLMSIYNSFTNSWSKTILPKEMLGKKCVAALNGGVYIFVHEKCFIFSVETQKWTICTISLLLDEKKALVINKSIYISTNKREVYNLDQLNYQFFKLRDIPKESQVETTNPFGFGASPPKRRRPHCNLSQAILNLDETLSVIYDNKMYIYNKLCDDWHFFIDIPGYVAGSWECETNIDMVSACTL